MPGPDRRRGAVLVLAAAVSVVFALAACGPKGPELAAPGGGAGAPVQPTTTEAATTAPPTTAAPTTAAPTTERPTTTERATTTTTAATTTTAEAGDEGSDVDWGLIALIGGIALAVVLLLWLLITQVSKSSRDQETLERRIAHLVGGSQWVHDQASLELMSGTQSPERLRGAWADTRRRVNDLAAQASEAAVTAHGDVAGELRGLSSALAALQGAMDTHVELRLQNHSPADAGARMAIDESAETVNERRHALRAAVARLAARV